MCKRLSLFTQKNLPKGGHFTYLEDPGIATGGFFPRDTQGGRFLRVFVQPNALRSATSFKVNEWPGRKRMKFVSWCYWRPPFFFQWRKKRVNIGNLNTSLFCYLFFFESWMSFRLKTICYKLLIDRWERQRERERYWYFSSLVKLKDDPSLPGYLDFFLSFVPSRRQ